MFRPENAQLLAPLFNFIWQSIAPCQKSRKEAEGGGRGGEKDPEAVAVCSVNPLALIALSEPQLSDSECFSPPPPPPPLVQSNIRVDPGGAALKPVAKLGEEGDWTSVIGCLIDWQIHRPSRLDGNLGGDCDSFHRSSCFRAAALSS